MKLYTRRLLLLLLVFFITDRCSSYAQNGSGRLQCEHLTSPIGVDAAQPRLSWQMHDDRENASQTAYQIWMDTDSIHVVKETHCRWNSGKVRSAQNLVHYQGPAPEPFTRYFWKVKLWDKDGKPLPRCPVTWFETAMMQPANWQGSWISDGGSIHTPAAPYFRKKIVLTKKIKQARAYVAAAGLFELYINGHKTGDHRLDPMYTRFDRRTLYVSHDVTQQLLTGENVIGVILGNGWYNHQSLAVWNFDRAPWRQRPACCIDLRITYTDGSTQTVSTDGSWKTHTGPIVFNSIYTGEHYDSRLEMEGWATANFADSTWYKAQLRAAPSRQIVSQLMAPIRNVDTILPVTMQRFSDSNYLFNLGRNIAGVVRIHLRGDSGTIVRLVHGERLHPSGSGAQAGHVDQSNIDVYLKPKVESDPFQTDIVTLNGKGEVTFMPRFNYKGFQYIEITSSRPVALKKEDLCAYFMHSDVAASGTLHTANPLINSMWTAANNSYLSNLFGYPTDCPQREKNGWTGDAHFAIESALYNYDAITVYEKWLADHRDEQQPNGVLPDIIPTGGWGYGTANGTDWTSTIAIIPWNLYLFYGDTQPLKDNYDNIRSYVNYVERISKGGLTTFGRGDWVPVKSRSSLELTSSIYFYTDAAILSRIARVLGHQQDAQYYKNLAHEIKTAINKKYFDTTKNSYGSGYQTELSMALYWKIVPEGYEEKVAATLAKRVLADSLHLDVGVLGAKAILNALSENGHTDIAYRLATQNTYPSWGWWIVNGATTLYENWNIDAAKDISLNHMMFGEIGSWFYKGLGGIKPDPEAPGFQHVLLTPYFVTGLDSFNASHNGPFGTIRSNWRWSGKQVIYQVTIPANSTGTVSFPKGIHIVLYKGQRLVKPAETFTLPAGRHEFVITI